MKFKMSKLIVAASTIGAFVMAATPLLSIGGFARAAEPVAQPVRIELSDLNLASARDVAVFSRRLDEASYTFCIRSGAGDGELSSLDVCRQAVRQEAVQKLTPSQRQDLRAVASAPASLRLAAR
ncbi:MAG: UrcA family protein [Caulobacteraceae bacterium]